MGRRTVEIEVVFLDVLAVVALAVGQAEQPFLEDRVFAIPQGQGKTQPLMVVAEPRQAVFAPMIGAGPRLVVGEVVPRVAILAVILADGLSLALAEVRSPLPPRHPLFPRLVQTQLFDRPGWISGRALGHG